MGGSASRSATAATAPRVPGVILGIDGEEARGTPDEDKRHQQIDRNLRCGSWEQHAAEGIYQADEERGDERAMHRADPADNDHHEGEDQDALSHPDLDREDRPRHTAG